VGHSFRPGLATLSTRCWLVSSYDAKGVADCSLKSDPAEGDLRAGQFASRRPVFCTVVIDLTETDRLILLRNVVKDTRVPDTEFRDHLEGLPECVSEVCSGSARI
jgi:hypothetical protein